jgi:alpha-glucosidase
MRTVVNGDSNRHLTAMTLLMTYPGVPSIYAGDEIGIEGEWGEDGRRTMPWRKRESWDNDFLAQVTALIAIRKESDALSDGGLRWVAVQDDLILFLRESKKEKLLIFLSRCAVTTTIDLKPLGLQIKDTLFGIAAEGDEIVISSPSAAQAIWRVI